MMIKLPKVKYGPEATSILRKNKHIGIETSTTRRSLYSSLSKQLIYFLLDKGMMSYNCLNIELLEIMEQGKWRWWPLSILSTNLLEVMLLHWSKIGELYQSAQLKKMMMMRVLTLTYQEHHPPKGPYCLDQ